MPRFTPATARNYIRQVCGLFHGADIATLRATTKCIARPRERLRTLEDHDFQSRLITITRRAARPAIQAARVRGIPVRRRHTARACREFAPACFVQCKIAKGCYSLVWRAGTRQCNDIGRLGHQFSAKRADEATGSKRRVDHRRRGPAKGGEGTIYPKAAGAFGEKRRSFIARDRRSASDIPRSSRAFAMATLALRFDRVRRSKSRSGARSLCARANSRISPSAFDRLLGGRFVRFRYCTPSSTNCSPLQGWATMLIGADVDLAAGNPRIAGKVDRA